MRGSLEGSHGGRAHVRDDHGSHRVTPLCGTQLKLYYQDGPNEVAKGFDSVHVVLREDEELDLWLGESKLYTDMKSAAREAAASLAAHVESDFLRQEFTAVTHKLDEAWPHAEKLRELLDENTSLDDIVERIVIPVFLAYESPVVDRYDRVSAEYICDLIKEARQAWSNLKQGLDLDLPVVVRLMVLPLESAAELRTLADQRLAYYKEL